VVADRREKFVQQVTVSCMELKDFEPCFKSAPGTGLERIDDAINASLIQGDGHRMSFVKWDRTRADYWPAALLGRLEARPPFPRLVATPLPTGMRQLDAGNSALAVDEFSDARQQFDVLVFPDSEVSR
jgi:hypothetical protein